MSIKTPVLMGVLRCGGCDSPYIEVQMMNMGLSPGVDHLDFYCQVCKKFISHINASPYEELDKEKLNIEQLNQELEEESSS